MGNEESRGKSHDIVNGIGIGFFSSIFLSLYISNFTDITLPIWLVYGIFAPFISALAITAFIYSSREKRDRFGVKYWAETEQREKEKEKQW